MLASSRFSAAVCRRTVYTLPKTIDTGKVTSTFPKRQSNGPKLDKNDPKLYVNRTKPKPKKPSLLPPALPTTYEALDAQLKMLKEKRQQYVGKGEFTKEDFDRMERQVQNHLKWEVAVANVNELSIDEEEEEEDLTELDKLERAFKTMSERRNDGRRWDDLADINRQELREFKRLQLKLANLKREAQELGLPTGWAGLPDSMGMVDEDIDRVLKDLESDSKTFTDVTKLTASEAEKQQAAASMYENQFPYQNTGAAQQEQGPTEWTFEKAQRNATQSLAERKARLTTKHKLVPKDLAAQREELWSANADHLQKVTSLEQRMDSYLDEFAAFQRELQFKRRKPVCDFFWLEEISNEGFAKLNEVYDSYVYQAPLGNDAKEEELLLTLLKGFERARLVEFEQRIRESDFITPLAIGETAGDLSCVGRYQTIGHWIFDREVPRSFEKYEWSPKMLRLQSLEIEDYEEEDQPEIADQIEQFFDIREKTFLMNRWELKYDQQPLVAFHNRQLMLREPGVKLCHELEIASRTDSSICKLLLGPRGVGKSATLLHTVAWARENGWITVVLPRAADLVSSRGAYENGVEEYGINVMAPDSTINGEWYGQPLGAEEVLDRIKLTHLHELSQLEQQREYSHKLYDAPNQGKKTLAHILMRGLKDLSTAPDALYDLRMELNLQTKYPVLVAVDEFDALYWPTAVWYNNLPVPAHKLTVCKAFRFIDHVPGDIEDDKNPRTVRKAKVNPALVPKRGGIIAACTRSLECEPHESQIPPCRFETFNTEGVDYVHIPKYTADEVEKAVMWYKERNCYDDGEVDDQLLGKIRALTGGFADKVAIYSQNRNINYPRHI